MSQGEQFERFKKIVEQDAEILNRLADPDRDVRALAQAKVAYAASKPGDWIEYTDEDLEALRREYAAFDDEVDKDFFEEDEPVEDVRAAFDAGEKVVTADPRGVGWCAPSP